MNFLVLCLALTASPAAPAKSAKSATAPSVAPAAAGQTTPVEGCGGQGESGECHHGASCAGSTPAPQKTTDASLLLRGDKLKGLAPVTLETLLANPADYDGKAVSITAKVRKSCERKGCWMELASSEKAPGVRVTFKDYGFFVPLDSAGKTAKVEGTVKVAELSPERAKHYESEGAMVAKDKSGKYREVQLVANGLELRK